MNHLPSKQYFSQEPVPDPNQSEPLTYPASLAQPKTDTNKRLIPRKFKRIVPPIPPYPKIYNEPIMMSRDVAYNVSTLKGYCIKKV